MVDVYQEHFEWHREKSDANLRKHGVDFDEAMDVFLDPHIVFQRDEEHSLIESRWFAIGKVARGVLTVRYTIRAERIRIIGAGFWKWGKEEYEKRNK